MENKIEIYSLNVNYENKVVLHDFSYSFPAASVTAIMGKSGAGKTTLINSIMNLIKYDGIIKINGGTRISTVFQEDRLINGMSIYRNLHLTAPSLTKEEIVMAMKAVGLNESINTKVSALSGGMKRRVAILRALLSDSDILIMDEPFKGLDDSTKQSVMSYIKEKLPGRTMLLVTHDKSEAQFFNSQILSF